MRRAAPFVARAGVVTYAGAALDAARRSRGILLVVTGEPGVGKSRLAEEVAARAEDFRVVWTWCTPAGALGPWSRVVRALAGTDAGAAQTVRQSPYLSELVAAGQRPDAPPDDLKTSRWRLSVDLADLFAACAASQPLLVVIDDVHDADPSSLQLLVELAPALRAMAAVVLVTARDEECDWRGRGEMWATLNRLGESLRLRPFGETDIAALLSQTLGTPPSAEAARTIAERTRGNPLLVCELVGSLPDSGSLSDLDRVMPVSVRTMVGARLANLTDLSRRVLSTAAVLGTRFRLDVVAEVTEISLAEFGAAMSEVRAAGLVDDAEPGEGQFRHDLIRDAIYDALPINERMRVHGRAGAVLAVFAQRGRDVEAAEVAHHLLRTGPGSAHEAAEFASQAGSQAGGNRAGARCDLLEAAERARRAARPDLLARRRWAWVRVRPASRSGYSTGSRSTCCRRRERLSRRMRARSARW